VKRQSSHKPHELAYHVAILFRSSSLSDMQPVKFAMRQAIELLQTVKPTLAVQPRSDNLDIIESWKTSVKSGPDDLKDPENGIPFALQIEKGNYPEKVKSAARLLILCLHAIERGETTESERQNIPLQLAALAGYVPDQNSRSAKNKRPKRSEDALDRGIMESLIAEPSASWQERSYWLKEEGIVIEFNSETLKFTDGNEESEPVTISIRTFQNRIARVRKKQRK